MGDAAHEISAGVPPAWVPQHSSRGACAWALARVRHGAQVGRSFTQPVRRVVTLSESRRPHAGASAHWQCPGSAPKQPHSPCSINCSPCSTNG